MSNLDEFAQYVYDYSEPVYGSYYLVNQNTKTHQYKLITFVN